MSLAGTLGKADMPDSRSRRLRQAMKWATEGFRLDSKNTFRRPPGSKFLSAPLN
jgi:hypothetical protein